MALHPGLLDGDPAKDGDDAGKGQTGTLRKKTNSGQIIKKVQKMENIADERHLKKSPLKSPHIILGSLLLVAITAAVAWFGYSSQIKIASQETIARQRDLQQAWVDKSLDSIRSLTGNLLEQARFVSSAEMFRLLAAEMQDLDPAMHANIRKQLASMHAGSEEKKSGQGDDGGEDAGGSGQDDEAARSLAEQLSYMQGVLQDFASRRGWSDLRIVSASGIDIVTTPDAAGLKAGSDDQRLALLKRAAAARTHLFGPVLRRGEGLVLDLADPLYEVLGGGEPKIVAWLLATVPVDRELAECLAVNQEQKEIFRPCLISTDGGGDAQAVVMETGKPMLAKAAPMSRDLTLTFARRPSFAGHGDSYSLGSRIGGTDWGLVLEVPAALVDRELAAQSAQIAGLWGLGGLGVFLLLAWFLAGQVSRTHKKNAAIFKGLYQQIHRQKAMLDSMNASLKAGLVLVGPAGDVQVANPSFCAMIGREKSEVETALVSSCLPADAAEILIQAMSAGKDSTEISLGSGESMRLYRVTLFPFNDQQREGDVAGGHVGIFQDITEFRRRAEEARQRQVNSMASLARAVESVDPNLIGHAWKMEKIVALLGAEMALPERDRETLRLAARLSQVGKIFVPRELLTKQGKLSEEEQRKVRLAPEHAYMMLRDMQFNLPVPDAVYQMGERLDGSGQPRQLKGDEINGNARILAVADAFCAMVSDRAYRAGMPVEKAVSILSENAGFDNGVVHALSRLNSADVAAVIAGRPEEEAAG